MNVFSVGFDMDRKLEFFSFLSPHKENNEYIFYPNDPIPKSIGSFLIEFINLNLDSEKEAKKFLLKYMTGYYLMELYDVRFLIEKGMHFSEKELKEYTKDIYEDLYDEMKQIQEDFINSIEHTFNGVTELIKGNHKEGWRDADYSECYLSELYATLFEYEHNILVEFDFPEYCYLSEPDKNGDYNANVEMGFSSEFIGNILYVCLRKLIFIKNILILRCENCHDFFIPNSLHYPKYCNKIHKDGKTCKEIGAILTYKKKLNEDEALKKYRSRYSSLSSNVSNYPDNPIVVRRLEEYKKIGAKKKKLYLDGKLPKEEFIQWIESTKLKNK